MIRELRSVGCFVVCSLISVGCAVDGTKAADAEGAGSTEQATTTNSQNYQTICASTGGAVTTVGDVIAAAHDATGDRFQFDSSQLYLWRLVRNQYVAARYVNLHQAGLDACQSVFLGHNTMLFFKVNQTRYRVTEYATFMEPWQASPISCEFWPQDPSAEYMWIGFDPGAPNNGGGTIIQ